jgi:ArsR family transcriptional regulator
MKSTSKSKQGLSPRALARVAQRFALLSDPSRLAILQALMEGECAVGELAAKVGQSQANVSRHLGLLSDDGLVSRRKEGVRCHYRIADRTVERMCTLVCDSLAKQLESERREFS